MFRSVRASIFLAFLSGGAILGQPAAKPPNFEVASVKPVAGARPALGGDRIQIHPGSLAMSDVRLRSCIQWAYGVKDYQVSGPDWLGAGFEALTAPRYDILAKAPPDTPVAQLRLMLQTLLAERFHLALHRETRVVPSFVLVFVKKSPLLHPVESANAEPDVGGKGIVLNWRNTSMAEFAELISSPLGMPVVDMTHLAGRFDFDIAAPGYYSPVASLEDAQYALADSVRQLGLKLQRRKLPLEMLVVDHVEKTPAQNQ